MSRTSLANSAFTDLKLRNVVHQVTSVYVHKLLKNRGTLYFGIDPTADALHLGNLLPIISSFRLLLKGNPVIAVIGSATASIGDPSGRDVERDPIFKDVLDQNTRGIHNSLTHLFENFHLSASKYLNEKTDTPVTILNNKEWIQKLNLVDFLKDYAKPLRLNSMINKDSVQLRLQKNVGINLAEFMYQSLQAYDYYYLHKNYNCRLQLGGSDQWGNITLGLDLISKKFPNSHAYCYGLTLPLLSSSNGEKYGKSAGNALWLDSKKTPVYDFYHFFISLADSEVQTFLKYFTFYPLNEIENIMDKHNKDPSKRIAQEALAKAMVEIVHGVTELERVQKQTEVFFSENYHLLRESSPNQILEHFIGYSRFKQIPFSPSKPFSISELCVASGALPSKSSAATLAERGGLYFNGIQVKSSRDKVTLEDLIQGQFAVISCGKNKHWLIHGVLEKTDQTTLHHT